MALNHLGNKIAFNEGDLLEREKLEQAPDELDVVYHLAALASVPRSVTRPLDNNEACTGTVNLLDAARQTGVRREIYACSSSAYGNQPNMSKRETDLLGPLSSYAAA